MSIRPQSSTSNTLKSRGAVAVESSGAGRESIQESVMVMESFIMEGSNNGVGHSA